MIRESPARCCYDQAVHLSVDDHADSVLGRPTTAQDQGPSPKQGESHATRRSQGSAGGKTFQQISEEFAGLVPSVWEREGHKISRVATQLSMSPERSAASLAVRGVESHTARAWGWYERF